MFSNRSTDRKLRKNPFALARAVVSLAILLVVSNLLAPGLAQGPPDGGPPANSDRRQMDPCEQAVRPPGNSFGLQAQCEPLGGGGAAKGDFNGDGIGDLAIGVPGEDFSGLTNPGQVHVVYGSSNGLNTSSAQTWHQNTSGMVGSAEDGDQFGFALSAWDFGRSSHADLAVGIPFEDIFNIQFATISDAGAVQVIYGSASGLSTTGNQQWKQNNLSGDVGEAGDNFGRAVY